MDALRAGVDGFLERDEVGADEFGELAVLDDERWDGRIDRRIGGEFFEDFDVGGVAGLGLLERLDPEPGRFGVGLVEEDLGELLG